ncbi:hypothetical protein QQG55_25235 [Brugia pahangi]|uniref:ESPR domain-containing protein n=1 Tax=Brugia pahangi TaxID=6280 RepID=A0A0N4TWC2_BRUPA|nr:unnamed protein product [Brugia pahangi]
MTTTAKWRRRYREWKAEKEVSSYVSLATVGIAATASHINRNTDEDTVALSIAQQIGGAMNYVIPYN